MIDVTKVKSQILYLIKKANDKTEKNDADLTQAVETLVNGYYDLVIADNVKFSSEHSDTKKLYATNYNWFADLVGMVQKMAGTNQNLSLDDILHLLGAVKYTPTGNARDLLHIHNLFNVNTIGIIKTVTRGQANCVIAMQNNFTTNAS